MTLLFFDGLQDPLLVPKPEYQTGQPWSAVTTGRDGGANGAASGGSGGRVLVLPTAAATCIAACGYQLPNITALGNAGVAVMQFCSDTTPTVQLSLTVNGSGYIEARRGAPNGTLLGTSSGHAPIGAGVWNHIAAKVVLHTSAGSCVVKVNDVQVLNLTGVQTSLVSGSVVSMRYLSGTGSLLAWWDDIYVCDAVDATATQGRANNDFLGDIRVTTLYPTAAGDVTGWTPSTGANWAAVDETPPTTTDYVASVATATGTRDLYNCSDLTANATLVYGVRLNLYALKTDTGAALIKPCLKENSVVTSQASQGLSTSATALLGPTLFVKPSNSTPWGVADVNALQIGVEVG